MLQIEILQRLISPGTLSSAPKTHLQRPSSMQTYHASILGLILKKRYGKDANKEKRLYISMMWRNVIHLAMFTLFPLELAHCYYLRLLLHHVKRATSFKDTWTINGQVCNTYQDSCNKLSILKIDFIMTLLYRMSQIIIQQEHYNLSLPLFWQCAGQTEQ